MSEELIIFIITVVGAAVGTAITNTIEFRMQTAKQKEVRRKERMDFLILTLDKLIESHAITKSYLAMPSAQDQEFEINKGKLISLPLSVGDTKLNKYTVKIQNSNELKDIIELGEETITRLGEIIKEISKVD